MEFVKKSEFDELLRKDSYWAGRWEYTSAVISILERQDIGSALEIGSKELQVLKGSDIMDNRVPYKENPCKYNRDAGVSPWPIEDKQYDVLIALQVWEHLRGNQQDAFKEVMRTCKMAVLSFPYLWDCPNDPMHHNIGLKTIEQWTCGVKPVCIIPINNPRQNKKDERDRIIYFFKF